MKKSSQVLVPFINSLVVLDSEGDRLLAKYYDGRSKAEQSTSEAILHKKSKAVAAKSEGETDYFDVSFTNNISFSRSPVDGARNSCFQIRQ